MAQRCAVRVTYRSRARGEVAERELSPQRLIHYRNTWYLDAWCHTRGSLRRFSLDAMEHPVCLNDQPARDVPLADVEAAMDSGYGVYAGANPSWATLVFTKHAAQWVSHEHWHAQQRSTWLPDGRYQLEVPYTDPNELAMEVLRHADQVSIAADTGNLRETVRERVRRMGAHYACL